MSKEEGDELTYIVDGNFVGFEVFEGVNARSGKPVKNIYVDIYGKQISVSGVMSNYTPAMIKLELPEGTEKLKGTALAEVVKEVLQKKFKMRKVYKGERAERAKENDRIR